jgi:parallel beta-helix repeat protein
VRAKCEGVVEGLAIGNFDEDQGLWMATGAFCGGRPDRRAVTGNHIGINPDGSVPWPNLRGLRADDASGVSITGNVISHNRHSGLWMWRGAALIRENRMQNNGASGIFLGAEVTGATIDLNVISGHPQMGIAVARDAKLVTMQRNSMKDNGGLGIDWNLDGISPSDGDDHDRAPNAPLMLSARYDPATNVTTIEVSIQSQPVGRYYNDGVLDFYRNGSPDADGETWLLARTALPRQTVTATFDGDLRGQWINATWTRRAGPYSRTGDPRTDSHEGNFVQSTSELSNAVRVE